jgi:hypothetical protein
MQCFAIIVNFFFSSLQFPMRHYQLNYLISLSFTARPPKREANYSKCASGPQGPLAQKSQHLPGEGRCRERSEVTPGSGCVCSQAIALDIAHLTAAQQLSSETLVPDMLLEKFEQFRKVAPLIFRI